MSLRSIGATRQPRLVVSGWYGHGNLGDEALLEGIVDAVRTAAPDLDVAAMCDGDPVFMRSLGVRAFRRPRRLPRRPIELAAVLRASAFAVGGGGLIKDYGDRPGVIHDWLWPLRAAARLRRATMTYAIGVDDVRFAESIEEVRSVLPQLDATTVRDAGVAARLERLGVRADPVITADPALLLGKPRESETGPDVIVSMRHWFAQGGRVLEPDRVAAVHRELAAALDGLIDRHGISVAFLPFRVVAHDDDARACADVRSQMRHGTSTSILPLPERPRDAVALLGRHALIVGMRLHSLILGATTATPGFALAYMPKVTDFMEEIGLGDRALDLDSACEPGALTAGIETAYSDRQALRTHLLSVVPPLQQRARLNGEIAAALALGDRPRVRAALEALRAT